jgi:hypothetical protein
MMHPVGILSPVVPSRHDLNQLRLEHMKELRVTAAVVSRVVVNMIGTEQRHEYVHIEQ